MIKRIPIDDLKVGMYISDLNADWIPHSNFRKKGRIKSDEVIEKIKSLGVKDVYIDTLLGLDAKHAPTYQDIDSANQAKLEKASSLSPAGKPRFSMVDEMVSAKKLHDQAIGLVNTVMEDVKLGRAIEVKKFEDVADGMIDSIFRNQNALSCLGIIRDKDSYLMEHSVNLGVLMSVFGKSMELDRNIMTQAAVGALLHDIGKILIPDEILHKPSRLNPDEFEIMKSHVTQGRDILSGIDGFPQLSIMVVAQHHERLDGSGYPKGLKGDDISFFGRMAAVVDVYDAITADRCYHQGITPTAAIKKLLEWSEHHLDTTLVHHFIRCIGIYPVGSLVLMESGKLGAVIEANEFDQRLPSVRVMYHTKFRTYIKVEVLDLAKPGVQDRIVKAVDPKQYGIKVADFIY
ncbi:phosphohydrolase [Hahella sp. CCB-MM4]|uniref:HD-GYP domain-containing protein n=1 Tax=Hahella sp. (strain CCB-MM4) TaxID=1926491 RepID=UPI000B9C4132|nr:HD-GYP domain-containing protein [Hahella sp. CCB-MM4]OZG71295.1 phosphohydrolase [Hahella sp. CCB-MM4]